MRESTEVEVRTSVGDGEQIVAGTLYLEENHITFQYSPAFVSNPKSFDLAPNLPRSNAPFFFASLGPFSDSAPDRWGRKVYARSLKKSHISESEYLLGVNDKTRQGATRYFLDGVAVADDSGVPVVANLPDLLNAADAVEQDRKIPDADLLRLYRATGSLGGARPKASVVEGSLLWLAKFPKPNGDDWDVMGWEAVTLELARMSGICVPDHKVITLHDSTHRRRTVLLSRRFDRGKQHDGQTFRIPYISAMTALDSQDGDGGDWLDLVEFAREAGADTTELWRRAVFGASIGNLDDHLRNHGFLRRKSGWVLSPAFDMNPEPFTSGVSDVHELALFGDHEVTISQLMGQESLTLFAVERRSAMSWLSKLRSCLAQAVGRARLRGVDNRSVEVMESRFTHSLGQIDDLLA